MRNLRLGKSILIPLAVLAMAACASKPQHEVAIDSSASPTEQIEQADQNLMALKNSNAEVLASEPYRKAEKSLQKAKDLNQKEGNVDRVLREVALSDAWAADAREQMKTVEGRLSQVTEARKFAMHANASNMFPNRWKDAESDFEQLSRTTRDKPDRVDKKVIDLTRAYNDLEKDSVAKTNLDPAKQTIKKAREMGAAKYAPRSLKEADYQFDQSMQAIRGTPRNESEVKRATQMANQKAEMLLDVTRRATGAKNATSEELIRRNIAVQDHVNALEATSAAALSEREQAEEQRTEAEQRAAALEASMAAAKKGDLSTTVADIQKSFTKNEAEVYTQGSTVILRLKGLKFASGQAQVASSQYPLLKKVSDAIAMFENPAVTVEGHTDSTGSPANNRKLSQDRADNVREYLMSINDMGQNDIKAVGYGDERPLGSNRTPEGRAMNRRIDIRIE